VHLGTVQKVCGTESLRQMCTATAHEIVNWAGVGLLVCIPVWAAQSCVTSTAKQTCMQLP